jgi:hypothetical protein
MQIEDIRLTPEEIDEVICEGYGVRYSEKAIVPRTHGDTAIANAATDKAVKKMIEWVEWHGGLMEFINMHHEDEWQALKDMVKED